MCTSDEVIDILKSANITNSQEVIKNWCIKQSNTPIDEDRFGQFCYSFPIIQNDEEVATVTIIDRQFQFIKDYTKLESKYFGHEEYQKLYHTGAIPDDNMNCYLNVHKEFTLPKLCEGLNYDKFKAKDANGVQFEFEVVIGHPRYEDDVDLYNKIHKFPYKFENSISIRIDDIESGWKLGSTINKNIQRRSRTENINNILNERK